MHLAVLVDDVIGKGIDHLFPGNVAHEVVTLAHINDRHPCAPLAEFLSNAFPNAMRAACHDRYLILIFHHGSIHKFLFFYTNARKMLGKRLRAKLVFMLGLF